MLDMQSLHGLFSREYWINHAEYHILGFNGVVSYIHIDVVFFVYCLMLIIIIFSLATTIFSQQHGSVSLIKLTI